MGQKFDKNKYIICIDVDDKADEMSGTILIKNGLEYFNNLCKSNEYEPLTTLTEKTQGGGYHYYFYVDEETLNDLGGNKTGLNIGENVKVSIDYKTINGFIICAPSKIKFEEKKYKYKWVSDDVSINSIQKLPLFIEKILILQNIKTQEPIVKDKKLIKHVINKPLGIKYLITDEYLNELLNKLPSKYVNNYSDWLIITTILKSLNKLEIWQIWSKKSIKYDDVENMKSWNSITTVFDINLLIKILNDELHIKLATVQYYKEYTHIEGKQIDFEFDNRYVSNCSTYDMFINNDTLIIESDTGTGKTTAIAEHISKYFLETNDEFKIISVVNKISLASQHIQSFSDKFINLQNYQDKTNNIYNKNLVICINSLMMLSKLSLDELKKYIIFIDEINSFIEGITHNILLEHDIKIIMCVLIRIIKNCKKLIVCDALISDNVFNF
jgi:hypothetical protein